MERPEIPTAMAELKPYGMKAAFDEIVATALKRQHEPQRIVGDLLTATLRGPLRQRRCAERGYQTGRLTCR